MKLPAFIKVVGGKGWLFISLIVAVLIIWAVSCSRKHPEATPIAQPSKPPVTLSNEVPASERTQQAVVDSLNRQTP